MSLVDLSYLGLNPDVTCFRWPTPRLVEEAVKDREAHLLHNLAVAVRTGHTGRSPKDRFIVDDANTHPVVLWNQTNQPISAPVVAPSTTRRAPLSAPRRSATHPPVRPARTNRKGSTARM